MWSPALEAEPLHSKLNGKADIAQIILSRNGNNIL